MALDILLVSITVSFVLRLRTWQSPFTYLAFTFHKPGTHLSICYSSSFCLEEKYYWLHESIEPGPTAEFEQTPGRMSPPVETNGENHRDQPERGALQRAALRCEEICIQDPTATALRFEFSKRYFHYFLSDFHYQPLQRNLRISAFQWCHALGRGKPFTEAQTTGKLIYCSNKQISHVSTMYVGVSHKQQQLAWTQITSVSV